MIRVAGHSLAHASTSLCLMGQGDEQQRALDYVRDDPACGKFRRITVVSIAGHSDGRYAAEAISRTLRALPGSSGLLMSLQEPADLPAGVRFRPVGPMNRVQYSLFITYCLHFHVETGFALIVQDDGWALSGQNWRDEWFGFDYVGAPTHAASSCGRLYSNYSWLGQPGAVQLMNGGFSLRSHRFLEAPARFGIGYKVLPNPVLLNEDVQLCLILREQMESHGLAFASIESALHFSAEYMHPAIHGDLDLARVFGHHAAHRRLRENAIVEVSVTADEVEGMYREREMLAMLQRYGHHVVHRR